MTFDEKMLLTKMRIQQWYDHYNGQVYVAFSGGLDSTVLLHIVRSMYPEVRAVYNNTGLEFPEIKAFVKSIDNVTWLKPKMNYQQVITHYGLPLVSKEVSQKVNELKHTKSEKLRNTRLHGDSKGNGKLSKKWLFLVDAPFEMSHKCCDVLKKNPAKIFEKQTGLNPFIGVRNEESSLRKTEHVKYGCNAYELKSPRSRPLSLWLHSDILHYIKIHNLAYSKIYDMGYDRTGCAWCAFGTHMQDPDNNKFHLLKKTHPKIWNYAINKIGLGRAFDFINVKYGKDFNSDLF